MNRKIIFFVLLSWMGLTLQLSAESVPLSEEAKTIKPGIYQHYKGSLYEVVAVAHHSETLEELVTYRLLYGDYGYWVRPVSLFCETVLDADNLTVPRFRFLGEPGNIEMK